MPSGSKPRHTTSTWRFLTGLSVCGQRSEAPLLSTSSSTTSTTSRAAATTSSPTHSRSRSGRTQKAPCSGASKRKSPGWTGGTPQPRTCRSARRGDRHARIAHPHDARRRAGGRAHTLRAAAGTLRGRRLRRRARAVGLSILTSVADAAASCRVHRDLPAARGGSAWRTRGRAPRGWSASRTTAREAVAELERADDSDTAPSAVHVLRWVIPSAPLRRRVLAARLEMWLTRPSWRATTFRLRSAVKKLLRAVRGARVPQLYADVPTCVSARRACSALVELVSLASCWRS